MKALNFSALTFIVLLLCACSSQAPVEHIDDLTLADEISQAERYNGAFEGILDRVVLNVNGAWGGPFSKTDVQLLYLPAGSGLHDEETLIDTLKQSLADWRFDDEASYFDVTIVFRRKSRSGEQSFVATRIPLLANDGGNVYREDAILMLSLYPVEE